jgi:hypothetical protein
MTALQGNRDFQTTNSRTATTIAMFTVVARFADQLFTDRGPRTAAILPASGAGPAPRDALDAGSLSRLRLDVGRRVSYTWKFRTIGIPLRAEVAELADAQASGACGRKVVEVQILSSADHLSHCRREFWAGAEASDVGTVACVSSSALCNGCATAGR